MGGAGIRLMAMMAAAVLAGATPATSAQDTRASERQAPSSIGAVRYDVTFDARAAADGVIRVAMSFVAERDGPIVLSLPAWTPGSYELDNFARFIINFTADVSGTPLRWDKHDYDTWRVFPRPGQRVRVAFDYQADTLDTGMAWTAPDFTFFNGTNLFLFPEAGSLEFPARVTIHTEKAWHIATGMTSTGPREFLADNYHDLVDMPTFVGRFDLDSTQVGQQWYRLATYPAGVLAGAARAKLWDDIRKMMPPMAAVFGEVPWNTYTIEMVFDAGFPGGAALEHQNSHLGIYTTGIIGSPILASIVAHEIYHAWNVKRLRPAELVPYDYGRAQPTTLLWMSEGITDYYADLALVRGGVIPKEAFYRLTAGKINTESNSPPVALEDASLSTWIEPTDGTAFIYYPKGSAAGFLLDILIRNASDNRGSLDHVMRQLYQTTYKAGTGFTTEQWWAAVEKAAGGTSFEEFNVRFIDGRDRYPWHEVLPLAGLALTVDTTRSARIGVSVSPSREGIRVDRVTPGGAAAVAGIRAGDILLRVGEVEVKDQSFGAQYRSRYAGQPEGTPLEFLVRREGETLRLPGALRFVTRVAFAIRDDPHAGPGAVRIRDGILTGTVGP